MRDAAKGTRAPAEEDDLLTEGQQQPAASHCQQSRSRGQPVLANSQDEDTSDVQERPTEFPATSIAQQPPSLTASVLTANILTYSDEQLPGATTVSPDFRPITDQPP